MQENNYIKFGTTLFIICLVASGLLTSVYSLTKDKIEAQKENEEMMGLQEVLPMAQDFKFVEREDKSYYIGTDKNGKVVGYAFTTEIRGYSSDIITMVGLTENGVIQGIKILSQNETPGLGSKIVEVEQDKTIWSALSKDKEEEITPRPWFQEQFSGKNVDSLDQVETITGATISSTAVIDSIKEKAEIILREIKNGR